MEKETNKEKKVENFKFLIESNGELVDCDTFARHFFVETFKAFKIPFTVYVKVEEEKYE